MVSVSAKKVKKKFHACVPLMRCLFLHFPDNFLAHKDRCGHMGDFPSSLNHVLKRIFNKEAGTPAGTVQYKFEE